MATSVPQSSSLSETALEDEAVRRVTRRLLPFLFILYLIASIDRSNVAFAALQMSERGYPGFYAQPFDSQQPLKTPHGLKDPEIAVEALDLAANKLTKVAGRLDIAWGDLYRLRRGKIDLPGNGATDLLGTFRVIDYSPESGGRFTSESGDNFIAVVIEVLTLAFMAGLLVFSARAHRG